MEELGNHGFLLSKRGRTQVASGVAGPIYRVVDPLSGTLMSAEVIQMPTGDARIQEAFQQDIRTAVAAVSKLHHRGIHRYIGYNCDDSQREVTVIGEAVSGETLDLLLKHIGDLPKVLVQAYAWQILEGLQYLHRRGLAHGRLCAANIYVARRGIPRLANYWTPSSLAHKLRAGGKGEVGNNLSPQQEDARVWDLRCLGMLVLRMFLGGQTDAMPSSPQLLIGLTNNLTSLLPGPARSFVSICLSAAPSILTAERLQLHPFLVGTSVPQQPSTQPDRSTAGDLERNSYQKRPEPVVKADDPTPVVHLNVARGFQRAAVRSSARATEESEGTAYSHAARKALTLKQRAFLKNVTAKNPPG